MTLHQDEMAGGIAQMMKNLIAQLARTAVVSC